MAVPTRVHLALEALAVLRIEGSLSKGATDQPSNCLHAWAPEFQPRIIKGGLCVLTPLLHVTMGTSSSENCSQSVLSGNPEKSEMDKGLAGRF